MTAKRQSNVRTGADAPVVRAAIHARISLDKAGEAAGVGSQIDGCRNPAELEGWSIDEVLIDNDLSHPRSARTQAEGLATFDGPPSTLVAAARAQTGPTALITSDPTDLRHLLQTLDASVRLVTI